MQTKMTKKFPNYFKLWDEKQNDVIRAGINKKLSFVEIAKLLGRNTNAVVSQAERIGEVTTNFNRDTRCREIYVNEVLYEALNRSQYRS